MATKKLSMNETMKELEKINDWFQNEDIDLDEGLEKLQQAQQLTQQIKTRLNEVENKFIALKEEFSPDSE